MYKHVLIQLKKRFSMEMQLFCAQSRTHKRDSTPGLHLLPWYLAHGRLLPWHRLLCIEAEEVSPQARMRGDSRCSRSEKAMPPSVAISPMQARHPNLGQPILMLPCFCLRRPLVRLLSFLVSFNFLQSFLSFFSYRTVTALTNKSQMFLLYKL